MIQSEIQLKNISHSYALRQGSKKVFENLSLNWKANDFVSFLGPSGCGKSTLLRILNGLEKPKAGQIEMPVQSSSMVFQEPRLLPWRSVLENVLLPQELRGQELHSGEAQELLKNLGLAEFAHQFPNQLSGGMKMRAALARALSDRPELLLMDEPFSALDELTRSRLQEELRALYLKKKMGVVFVTHSFSEALFLSDRIFLIQGPGRIEEFSFSFPAERSVEFRTSDGYLKAIQSLAGQFASQAGA